MSPVLCQKHGEQRSQWVCEHLHPVVQLDAAFVPQVMWLRSVSSTGEAKGLFDYSEWLCASCAAALRGIHPPLPSTVDSLDALDVLLAAEAVVRVIPACTTCISEFRKEHGEPEIW